MAASGRAEVAFGLAAQLSGLTFGRLVLSVMRIAVLGPQFAEPTHVGRYLAGHFGEDSELVHLNKADRVLESSVVIPGIGVVQVWSVVRALFYVEEAYRVVMTGASLIVAVMAAPAHMQALNAEEAELRRKLQPECCPHAPTIGVFNDLWCGTYEGPFVQSSAVRRFLPENAPLIETSIGYLKVGQCERGGAVLVSAIVDALGSGRTHR